MIGATQVRAAQLRVLTLLLECYLPQPAVQFPQPASACRMWGQSIWRDIEQWLGEAFATDHSQYSDGPIGMDVATDRLSSLSPMAIEVMSYLEGGMWWNSEEEGSEESNTPEALRGFQRRRPPPQQPAIPLFHIPASRCAAPDAVNTAHPTADDPMEEGHVTAREAPTRVRGEQQADQGAQQGVHEDRRAACGEEGHEPREIREEQQAEQGAQQDVLEDHRPECEVEGLGIEESIRGSAATSSKAPHEETTRGKKRKSDQGTSSSKGSPKKRGRSGKPAPEKPASLREGMERLFRQREGHL